FHCGTQGFLDSMVARDESGVGTPHRLRTHPRRHLLPHKSRPPVSTPEIVSRRIANHPPNPFLLIKAASAEGTESKRIVNVLAVHRGQKPRGEVEIGFVLTDQSKLRAHAC